MSQSRSPVVLWFRRDLRLLDNPAVDAAARSGRPVIPLYVHDPAIEGRESGGASLWWLDKSLRALTEKLERIGSRLILRRGEAASTIEVFLRETGAEDLIFNRQYEPAAAERDRDLARRLAPDGVAVRSFNAALFAEPGAVLNGAGEAYKVFGPFQKALRGRLEDRRTFPAPNRLEAPASWPPGDRLADWRLHPTAPDWSAGFDAWTPGEDGALARLDRFLERGLALYPTGRDIPGRDGSSRLSPHLHFGEVSPWRVLAEAQAAAERRDAPDSSADKLVSELTWREFNWHLLHARPDLPARSFRPDFDRFPWRSDPVGLAAWKRGRTGYPLVDAGLRQLWATGWMHNRVRMVAASFLVKHLLIDWREGEAWFWDTLVDADLANNVGNWQWTAGSGADAAPYFRIFNPVTQGERFDPDGAYVRRWLPELAALPDSAIHAPWTAPEHVLKRAGVRLGDTYPRPIVDHAHARNRALSALAALRDRAQLLTTGPERVALGSASASNRVQGDR